MKLPGFFQALVSMLGFQKEEPAKPNPDFPVKRVQVGFTEGVTIQSKPKVKEKRCASDSYRPKASRKKKKGVK